MSLSSSRRAVGALLVLAVTACGRQAQVASSAAGAPAPAQSISITDGESVIRAMHAKYMDRWYRNITFRQTVSLLGASGQSQDQLWYVAMAGPGLQRIDYVNPDLGNGTLVRADSTWFFSNGRQVSASDGWNDLLLLTHDVYLQPPEVTISVLRSLGYQLSRLRTSSFLGKTAYVVGASSQTDSSSKQFWVERDRMILVRVREKRGEGQFGDFHLGDYIAAGNGWIAKQTYQMLNGVPRLHQQIAGVNVDVSLDSALFDPKQWSTVKHWSKP
jgi:hypothetical protein